MRSGPLQTERTCSATRLPCGDTALASGTPEHDDRKNKPGPALRTTRSRPMAIDATVILSALLLGQRVTTRRLESYNAAVERRRAALSSAHQAHNEMARLLRARVDV